MCRTGRKDFGLVFFGGRRETTIEVVVLLFFEGRGFGGQLTGGFFWFTKKGNGTSGEGYAAYHVKAVTNNMDETPRETGKMLGRRLGHVLGDGFVL